MRAAVQDRYSADPEGLLRLAEIPRPQIGPGEVLVRVHAASVDRGTWHLMAGLPYPVRAAGFGLRRPKLANPGRTLAGTVVAVGARVTGLNPGDEVFGIGTATFAEYARARADKLAARPPSLSAEQAATLGISGLTALQSVRKYGRVTAGQKVLVLGASGGVGAFALQLARAAGAEVTGVCTTTKMDLVRGLGADHAVDYTRDDALDGRTRYDVVIDTGGNRRLADLRRALTPAGRLVIVGGETGGRWLGGLDRQLRAPLLSPFVGQWLGSVVTSENADDLRTLAELCESGALRTAVDRTYPLAETAAAIRHLLDGKVRGKVVITV
ncbi:NAD(P)-dependent alcohol dehydrogenase [Krasilnikovia sp. MM14-A1004]|uniref:NAD(P)-dependent alcohol dehydrogenase n=1 Tax=Krasilnikovia sp. MM14-A1004 TaxID=3373541 RepID=UPI00399D370C